MNREKRQVLTTARVLGVREAKGVKGPSIDIQCIQAGMSLNYNFYPADVLKAAAPLYEGVRSFLDHTWELSVRNLAGSLDAAGWDHNAQAVTATLYPAIEAEAGQLVFGLAKAEQRFRNTGILDDDEYLFGFSHVVYGTGDWRDGPEGEYWSFDEILEVESVDAVSFPAANGYMKDASESRQNHLKSLLASEARKQNLPGLERVMKPQDHTAERAANRALGRALAAQHTGEDSARAWQGLPDPDDRREPSETEQLGLETARAWGARLE